MALQCASLLRTATKPLPVLSFNRRGHGELPDWRIGKGVGEWGRHPGLGASKGSQTNQGLWGSPGLFRLSRVCLGGA